MVFTLAELLDLVIMTLALGYIFKDAFKSSQEYQDPVHFYSNPGFDWNSFWYACAVVAPSIILHELAHKFTALQFGLEATFQAALGFLAIGVLLKLLNFGFIFFVPGYVAVLGGGTYLQHALISFMGPLVHLVLWLGIKYYFDYYTVPGDKKRFLGLTMQINKFLFILNMLPIPGIDGFSVYSNLLKAVGF